MPWCPKCGYEYKTGYTVCSDCNVELVESLELLKEDEEIQDMSDIFSDEDVSFEDDFSVSSDADSREKKSINAKSELYVDANIRATEYKLGAITLLMVGGVGLTAIILMNIGIIPFLPMISKALMNTVMGGMFLIFIIMGISSVGSCKKMLILAQKEEKLTKDIEEYFSVYVTKETLSNFDMSNLTKEEICLKQYEQISSIINANFSDVDPAFLEYITEKIYVNMFE